MHDLSFYMFLLFPICYSDQSLEANRVGLLFILMILEYPFLASLTAYLLVTFYLDPVYVVLCLTSLKWLSKSRILFVIRHVYLHIVAQIMLGHCRFCILLTVGMAVSLFRLISKQRKTEVFNISGLENQIVSVKNFNVLLTRLIYTVNPILRNILGVSYVLVVTGFCGVIYFANVDNLYFSFGFFVFTILLVVEIIVLFGIGAYLSGTSGQTLRKLKDVSKKWRSQRAMICRAQIKSLRPLHIKAGSFSLVNIDLMKGYLSALLESCINALLLMNSVFDAL